MLKITVSKKIGEYKETSVHEQIREKIASYIDRPEGQTEVLVNVVSNLLELLSEKRLIGSRELEQILDCDQLFFDF
jgi:hypothetical protein